MSAGPAVPLVLVAGLGWYIYGRTLLEEEAAFASAWQETLLPLILIVPATLLVIVLFINEITVIPLALLLAVYLAKVALIGPLLLVLTIRFLDGFRPSFKSPSIFGAWREGLGDILGFVAYGSLVFIMNAFLCEGGGCGWISLAIVLSTFIFFNLY